MKIAKKLILILLIISIISAISMVCVSAAGTLAYGAATIGPQGGVLRTKPDSKALSLTMLREGDIVVILERTNSEWNKINFYGKVGYVTVSSLRDILTIEKFNAIGYTTSEWVNMRADPKMTGKVVGTYAKYTEMTITGIENGWYRVKHDGHSGCYIRSDLMRISKYHSVPVASTGEGQGQGQGSTTGTGPRKITVPTLNYNADIGSQVANFAANFVGCPYIYGSAGPNSFDCSGLVYYVYYKTFGFTVSRTAGAQNRDKNGEVFTDTNSLRPGDLVFFSKYRNDTITHVGIFIGDEEFIHASRPGVGLIISNINSTYYQKVWHSGKRIDFNR